MLSTIYTSINRTPETAKVHGKQLDQDGYCFLLINREIPLMNRNKVMKGLVFSSIEYGM